GMVVGGLVGLGMFHYFRSNKRKKTSQANRHPRKRMEISISPGMQGATSPFAAIIRHLEQSGPPRDPAEPLSAWILGRQRPELLDLLRQHYQWRFDPSAMSEQKALRFKHEVAAWMQQETG
ncbi:MAG TPA: hypothetical protein HPQ00_06360, partial [Magnetococcales bacterium]|nr:hypothetical protein [Magnetococcales bacterium]